MAAISYPVQLPLFLAAGHAREIRPRVMRVPMEIGADRIYRTLTTAPQFAECSTWLGQSGFDVFYDFHEDALDAGSKVFNARMRGPGFLASSLEWWEARFLEPWQLQAYTASKFLITFKLLLVSGPFLTEPT